LKWCRFLKALFTISFKKPFSIVKAEIHFAAKAPNGSNYGARFMAVISLLPNYKTTVTTVGLSLAYKSQRNTMNKGRKKNKERGNVRKRKQSVRNKKKQQEKKAERGEQTGKESKRERERGE